MHPINEYLDVGQGLLYNDWSLELVTHIDTSGPSDAFTRQYTKPALVQIMACRLLVPIHYLN